ncbi:HAUS augmin-like complex subunit 2 isoform X1 [Tachysurus fulvidraco]|uniref:HAUS augmin-like complex subunit 2 isoform X1 n=1 Tax=Tachysurus fulvidraco TaxID=1234273 RepID=UPI000F51010E|nr:HAUS augmin-like complex subunit 2 isoform X1 [Tachysurus fulvidraco]XP_027028374.1 HAUS augmin-like complex subunit 2 isoform X1 [Tachysurus fulvidraco]XP_027028375.1 HAUS augmin-like complex subunit 2 isoform X1 [Tachysurus fulvidraco]
MDTWELNPHSVTPAAKVLARCVASGTMSQKELDDVPREPEIFSSLLLQTEQMNKIKQEIDQVKLDLELLRLEKNSADVTHSYHLCQRFASLQRFTSHLQEVLREQTSLRQRLMKPLCQQNLPIQANLQRYVVTLMAMVVEFIENLEMKIKMVNSIPTTDESIHNLSNGMTQLLAQVTEVESLTKQVLQQSRNPKAMSN